MIDSRLSNGGRESGNKPGGNPVIKIPAISHAGGMAPLKHETAALTN